MRSSLLALLGLSLFASSSVARADEGALAPVTALAVAPAPSPALAMQSAPSSTPDDGPRAPAPPSRADPLFPGAGRFTLGASTGVPFLAIGEAGYAFTDGFAVGAIAGITPVVGGVGVRPRGVLYSSAAARVFVVVPTLYYPATHMSGDEPWFLTNPVLYVDAPVADRWRVHAGPGLVFAACQDSLFGVAHAERFMGDVWPTLAVGALRPVGDRTAVFADVQAVLPKGVAFDQPWLGGPPFVLAVGVTTSP